MAGLAPARNALPAWREALRKYFFRTSGYNRLGLLYDDCRQETEGVKEALRRLPKRLLDERQFRMTRALYLSMRKEILPEEEWTKYEEDVRYLKPYLDEVEREFKEVKEWKKK